MGEYRVMYAIKSYDTDLYFKGFNGKEFLFTEWINEAKMWTGEKEPNQLLGTHILGINCLMDCGLIKISISECQDTHQHEDKGE